MSAADLLEGRDARLMREEEEEETVQSIMVVVVVAAVTATAGGEETPAPEEQGGRTTGAGVPTPEAIPAPTEAIPTKTITPLQEGAL